MKLQYYCYCYNCHSRLLDYAAIAAARSAVASGARFRGRLVLCFLVLLLAGVAVDAAETASSLSNDATSIASKRALCSASRVDRTVVCLYSFDKHSSQNLFSARCISCSSRTLFHALYRIASFWWIGPM